MSATFKINTPSAGKRDRAVRMIGRKNPSTHASKDDPCCTQD
jgi:hypothetical protein